MTKFTLSQSLVSLKDSVEYKAQKKSVDFLAKTLALMQERGVTKKELATIVGCTPAYISKLFNGSANMSLETMVKLADALNSEVNIQICDKHQSLRWFGVVENQRKVMPRNFKHEVDGMYCGVFELDGALSNDENFALAA